jgi:hypothetical protein
MSELLGKALSFAGGLKVYAIVAAACLAIGAAGMRHYDNLVQAAAQAHAITQTLKTQWVLDKKSYDAGLAAGKAKVVIQTVTKTLIREVPTYVTAQNDAECPVPVGFVRLYNAAIAQSNLAPASGTDGAPSGVALSAVISTDLENIGTYNEVADQLKRLQAWEADRVATETRSMK